MHPFDELDLAILSELESNARIMITELARRLSSPPSTIRDRIQRLNQWLYHHHQSQETRLRHQGCHQGKTG